MRFSENETDAQIADFRNKNGSSTVLQLNIKTHNDDDLCIVACAYDTISTRHKTQIEKQEKT